MTDAVKPTAPPTIWEALATWASSLKKWQQLTLALAVKHGRLSDEQVKQVGDTFLAECGLSEKEVPALAPVEIVAPSTEATGATIQLIQVDELCGVNALPEGAKLIFGPNLTVIYGRNGAGKSGFARLFANACFCRNTPEIVKNIYSEDSPATASAKFHLKVGGQEMPSIAFPGGEGVTKLKAISVFDRFVAERHISTTMSFEFKPSGFDVFPEMARIYGKVAELVQLSIQQRTEENTFPASFLGGTTIVSEMMDTLGASTSRSALKKLATYGATEKARFELVESQLFSLRSSSPKTAIAAFEASHLAITALLDKLKIAESSFSSDRQLARNSLTISAKSANANLAAASIDQFKRAFFNAVGSSEWEDFVASAHALGQKEHEHYPAEAAHCLLCERPLDESSKKHIQALFGFIVSEAQQVAVAASEAVEAEIASVEAIDLGFFPEGSVVREDLKRLKPELEIALAARIESLGAIRFAIVEAMRSHGPIDNAKEAPEIPDAITSLLIQITADIVNLSKENKEEAISELDKERLLLRHREVLASILPNVEKFVENAEWCAKASKAKAQFSTKRITEKEKELFGAVLGDAYRSRLAEECVALDCDVPVEMQTQGKAGETVRALVLKGGHKPDRILSEGEQKALALADFLTETGLNAKSGGIILDDPVSSQDHQRKELVALRLVKEASARQVIVFTHDLVFLNQLVKEAEDSGLLVEKNRIDRHSDGTPGLVRFGEVPATSKEYDSANKARWLLAMAKKASGTSRDDTVRQGMGALRTTVEQIIPKHLFKGVVPRWSDRVMVTGLRKIAWDNALADEVVELFEDLSKYLEGHSHTDEASGAPPEPKDLEIMIGRADDLIKRAKAERKSFKS